VPLPAELEVEPLFFKHDNISGEVSMTPGGGVERPATREECFGLERAAVWDPEHVVSRLDDHFAGRPNAWVDLMRLK
jgi:hypothetical protein